MWPILWIIGLTPFLSGIQSIDHKGEPFTVITYNIRLDHAGDGPDNWMHRKEDMVSYVKQSQPDFLGLQEAMHHQLQYLLKELPAYQSIGVARDDGKTEGEYSPILFDKDRWTCLESGTLWLSESPDSVSRGWDAACNRVITFGYFRGKGEHDVFVCNTHLDHAGAVARQESIKLIVSILREKARGLPTVLMGDFNFSPDDPNYALITAAVQDAADKPSGTFNGFKEGRDHPNRIDYIFTANRIRILKYDVDYPVTGSGRQVSDHFPVRAKLLPI